MSDIFAAGLIFSLLAAICAAYDIARRHVEGVKEKDALRVSDCLHDLQLQEGRHERALENLELRADSQRNSLELARDGLKKVEADLLELGKVTEATVASHKELLGVHERRLETQRVMLVDAMATVEGLKKESTADVNAKLVELRDWSVGEFAAMKTAFDRATARDAVAAATVRDTSRQFG